MALRWQVFVRFILAALIMPVILFSLAGILHYLQGWLYYVVVVAPMLATAGYFLKSDPQFLERRMKFCERDPGNCIRPALEWYLPAALFDHNCC